MGTKANTSERITSSLVQELLLEFDTRSSASQYFRNNMLRIDIIGCFTTIRPLLYSFL
jgi:hypothetical protein